MIRIEVLVMKINKNIKEVLIKISENVIRYDLNSACVFITYQPEIPIEFVKKTEEKSI